MSSFVARLVFVAALLLGLMIAPQPASACDCAGTTPEQVFARASPIFIGRAAALDFETGEQPYQVLAVLEGTTETPKTHTVRFGTSLSNCMALMEEGDVALIALVDGEASVCMGSGHLPTAERELARTLELAGATAPSKKLPAEQVLAVLGPMLAATPDDVDPVAATVYVSGAPVAAGEHALGERTVHFVDGVDGVPGEASIVTFEEALVLGDLVYVRLLGAHPNRPTHGLLLDGEFLWAFGHGGALRVPEPR